MWKNLCGKEWRERKTLSAVLLLLIDPSLEKKESRKQRHILALPGKKKGISQRAEEEPDAASVFCLVFSCVCVCVLFFFFKYIYLQHLLILNTITATCTGPQGAAPSMCYRTSEPQKGFSGFSCSTSTIHPSISERSAVVGLVPRAKHLRSGPWH